MPKPVPPSASIGHVLTERRGKSQRPRTGTAIAWEYTGSTIRNMKTGEEWPGFRFLMQGPRGAEWYTITYPDKTKPRNR